MLPGDHGDLGRVCGGGRKIMAASYVISPQTFCHNHPDKIASV